MAPGVRSSLGRGKTGSCGCPVGTQQRPDAGVNVERADEAAVLGTFWNACGWFFVGRSAT